MSREGSDGCGPSAFQLSKEDLPKGNYSHNRRLDKVPERLCCRSSSFTCSERDASPEMTVVGVLASPLSLLWCPLLLSSCACCLLGRQTGVSPMHS